MNSIHCSLGSVTCEFIATSCAQFGNCVDWGDRFVAFVSSRNVCLMDIQYEDGAARIVSTHAGHGQQVTCLKWVKTASEAGTCFLLSGSADHTVILWRLCHDSSLCLEHVLKGHSQSLSYVCGIQKDADDGTAICIVSCAADDVINVWQKNDDGYQILQSFPWCLASPLCIDLHAFLNGIIMASGHTDGTVRLYAADAFKQKFSFVIQLEGHTDWVRGLSWKSFNGDVLLLVSVSQDTFVRLWKVAPHSEEQTADSFGTTKQLFRCAEGAKRYAVQLDSILWGHKKWIFGVSWSCEKFLTVSMDSCLIIWHHEAETSCWTEEVRLGELTEQDVGFFAATVSPDGKVVIGVDFEGGFHSWHLTDKGWSPFLMPTGHFGCVEKVCWDPLGMYLLSCGKDKTVRLYAPWRRKGHAESFHEIARPQVHGYEMSCICCISSCCFVSGADEKILRAFVAPATFVNAFCTLTRVDATSAAQIFPSSAIFSAEISPLSLTNKALSGRVYDEEGNSSRLAYAVDEKMALSPPVAAYLSRQTLWPEVYKLYGHGFEIFAVCANHAGTVIASSCKATNAQHASIILWSTEDWSQRAELSGHSLTITSLRFSPSDSHLLSVSRDRTWCLYGRGSSDFEWTLLNKLEKRSSIHARIIWDCCWSPDSLYFFTGSRDRKLVPWKTSENDGSHASATTFAGKPLQATDSVTALDASRTCYNEGYLIAVGYESGEISGYFWDRNACSFSEQFRLDKSFGHSLAVKSLKFRPSSSSKELQIASCSDDHSVKLFKIQIAENHSDSQAVRS